MKKISLLLIAIFHVLHLFSQSLSPSPDANVYCTNSPITFTLTLNGDALSPLAVSPDISTLGYTSIMPSVSSPYEMTTLHDSANPSIVKSRTFKFNITFLNGYGTLPQAFRFSYINASSSDTGSLYTSNYIFTKIKVMPTTPLISGSLETMLCNTDPISISFPPLQYTSAQTPTSASFSLGSILKYEYALPIGWSINGIPSTDSTIFIPITINGNNVTISPNATGGINGHIKVRAIGDCGEKGVISQKNIFRTNFSITGNNALCSTSANYSLNNKPENSTIAWSSSNSNAAYVSTNADIATLNKIYGGSTTTLTADLTSACGIPLSPTISTTKIISLEDSITADNTCSFISFSSGSIVNSCVNLNNRVVDPYDFNYYYGTYNILNPSTTAAFSLSSKGNNTASMVSPNGNIGGNILIKPINGIAIYNIKLKNSCNTYTFTSAFLAPNAEGGFLENLDTKHGKTINNFEVQDNNISPNSPLIFPNPTKGVFTISKNISKIANDSYKNINIINQSGITIIQKKVSDLSNQKFDLSKYPAGLYYIKITDGEKTEIHKLLLTK